MAYNYDRKLRHGKMEIRIDTAVGYGYMEHDDNGEIGGLWFSNRELTDFDGCSFLSIEAARALHDAGYVVDPGCVMDGEGFARYVAANPVSETGGQDQAPAPGEGLVPSLRHLRKLAKHTKRMCDGDSSDDAIDAGRDLAEIVLTFTKGL